MRCFACFALIGILALASSPCLGAGKRNKVATKVEDIKQALKNSRAKQLRVTVVFKSGSRLSGQVEEVSDTSFKLRQDDTSSAASVNYYDLVSIRHESRLLKGMKAVGKCAGLVAAGTVILPIFLVSCLIGHPIGPTC